MRHLRQLLIRKRVRFFASHYDVLNRQSRDPVAFAMKTYTKYEVTVYRDNGRGKAMLTVKPPHEHRPPLMGLEAISAPSAGTQPTL